MHRNPARKFLFLGQAVLIAATVVICVWAVFWPMEKSTELQSPVRSGMIPMAQESQAVVVDQVWSRNLRGDERDEGIPDTDMVAPPIVNQLPLYLLGTMIEEEQSFAMIADDAGNVDTQTVGGVLQLEPHGIRIERIESGSVTVSHQNRRDTLLLQAGYQPLDRDRQDDAKANFDVRDDVELSLDEQLDRLNGKRPAAGANVMTADPHLSQQGESYEEQ